MHARRAAQNLDILAQVRRELQKEGYLKTPKVFIHPACSGDMPRLQRIVSQLGGELMPSESAPLSTTPSTVCSTAAGHAAICPTHLIIWS